MKPKDKKLLMVGVIIALILSVVAPYAASSNPDGLESAAEEFESADGKEEEHYESPMPDYSAPGVEDEGASGVVAIVLGTIIMIIIVFTLMYGLALVKRKKRNRGKEEKRK